MTSIENDQATPLTEYRQYGVYPGYYGSQQGMIPGYMGVPYGALPLQGMVSGYPGGQQIFRDIPVSRTEQQHIPELTEPL